MKRLDVILALSCLAMSGPPLPPKLPIRKQLKTPLVAAQQVNARMAKPTPPPIRSFVTLGWTTPAVPNPGDYVTGVVATTNFTTWSVLVRQPYATTNQVTLTNRPTWEFYRAFNDRGN